jgi:CRISPR/Cas system-associated exonuclease Cas4 (RecB family)
MSKSVEDGIVKLLSPSMINKFDSTQSFGCERRWWYRYVKGLDEPQTGNQELGEKLHALIEHRLKTGETPVVEHEAAGLYLAGQAMIESVAQRTIIGIERALPRDFTVDGTPFSPMSKCDVVLMDGIIDWKTSSDINRYGKTERELATDTQMVLYALAFHPTTETVKLAHGQFQTRGRKATNFVEVEVTDKHLASHRDNVIIPLVQKMKSAASESDVRKLPRNEKSCFNCAYKPHCPTAEGENIMSFFSKMKPAAAAPEVQPVLPPDAPKSDPAKAAEPVEGFSPVPAPRRNLIVEAAPSPSADLAHEAPKPTPPPAPETPAEPVKRGRGRPPGSKNRPKEPSVTTDPNVKDGYVIAYDPAKIVNAAQGMIIKSRTVTKGYTVNVGAFNSVRFDFSATAEGGTDEELRDYVDSVLEAEVSKYQAEVDAKNKVSVPAKEVVLK